MSPPSKGTRKTKGRLYSILSSPKVQTLVIAVPGLATPPPEKWQSENGRWREPRLWFESIPSDVAPGLSVHGYRHDLDFPGLAWGDLLEQGKRFVHVLVKLIEQSNLGHCPVLIVCHSLGGLIVKEALHFAYQQEYRNLLRTLAGVILLGTPHYSTEDKWKNAAVTLSNKKRQLNSDDLSKLSDSSMRFEQARVRVPILSVYETKETRVKKMLPWPRVTRTLIMDEAFVRTNSSNEELLGIAAEHSTLCHMDTGTEHFAKISAFIGTSLEDARLKIVKGSPIVDAPSSFGDWSDMGYDESGRFRGSASRSTGSRSQSRANTVGGTAGTPDMGFEMIPPALASYSSFPINRPPGSRFPLFMVPVAPNRDFFGREKELSGIERAFFGQDEDDYSPGHAQVRTFAICGPGGMGKTQLAGQFVHSQRNRFDVVFWVHADTKTKLQDEFGHLAVRLGLVASESADARDPIITRSLVKGWLAHPLKEGGKEAASWLLVFDNIDDTDVLADFWPLDGPGCVLFTSRDSLAKKPTHLADTGIDLEPFSLAESSSFLEKLTQKKGDSSGVHARLGGLPLAMTQMASVIIRRDLSYAEFVQSYDEVTRREELFQFQQGRVGYNLDYEKSIWSVWALESLKHGRSLLEVISMLDPDGILEELLTGDAAEHVALDGFPKRPTAYYTARGELLQSSLISRDSSSMRVVVHRLIQDTARAKMSAARFSQTFDASLHLVSSMWPYEEFGWRHGVARWARCEELFPHVVALRRLADQAQASEGFYGDLTKRLKLPKLLIDAGWYHHETGHSAESETYFEFSATLCRSIQTQLKSKSTAYLLVHRDAIEAELESMIAEVHHNLGCIGTETNRPEFTLHHFQLYNEMMIKHSGSQTQCNDSRLHISWNELGNAFMMNGRLEEGERCFKTSIESAKLRPDYTATDTSFPHVNLGLAYWLMGRHEDALKILTTGLSDREQAFGVDDSQSFITGRFLHALGNVNASLGLDSTSVDFHRRALVQYEKTIGKNHHRTGDVHVKMAEHRIRENKLTAARYVADPAGRISAQKKQATMDAREADFARAAACFSLGSSHHISEALRIFADRPAFRHEKMRALFKKAKLLSAQGREVEAVATRNESATLYRELFPGDAKAAADLTDDIVNAAVAFWSR